MIFMHFLCPFLRGGRINSDVWWAIQGQDEQFQFWFMQWTRSRGRKKKRLFKKWKESNNSYAGYRLCDFNILLSSQQARVHIKDLTTWVRHAVCRLHDEKPTMYVNQCQRTRSKHQQRSHCETVILNFRHCQNFVCFGATTRDVSPRLVTLSLKQPKISQRIPDIRWIWRVCEPWRMCQILFCEEKKKKKKRPDIAWDEYFGTFEG